MSIINEDRLRELIDGRVKAMKPDVNRWPLATALCWGMIIGVVVFSGMLAHWNGEHSGRLSRLETIVAKDRTFAHGVASYNSDNPTSFQSVIPGPRPKPYAAKEPPSPVISIQPRALPESELPKAKEGQP